MEKHARSKSTDPAQEHLREHKSVFNKETSTFIADLIQFKKMMNGSPNKFHNEKASIKDPLPTETSSVLNHMLSQFQELAQEASSILREQDDYSKNRKKKQNPTAHAFAHTDAFVSLSEKINELEKQASNPFSRFLTRLKTLNIFNNNEAKYQVSFIDGLLDFDKACKKLKSDIVGSGEESIIQSVDDFTDVLHTWGEFKATFENYKSQDKPNQTNIINVNKKPETPKTDKTNTQTTPSQEINKPSESGASITYSDNFYIQHAEDAIKDNVSLIELDKLTKEEKQPFRDAAASFKKDKNVETAKFCLQMYDKLLELANQKYDVKLSSFKEIYHFIMLNKKEAGAIDYLNKLKHKFKLFDKTSVVRIDIYNRINKMHILIDKMLNAIQKEVHVEQIDLFIQEVEVNLQEIKDILLSFKNKAILPHKSIKL